MECWHTWKTLYIQQKHKTSSVLRSIALSLRTTNGRKHLKNLTQTRVWLFKSQLRMLLPQKIDFDFDFKNLTPTKVWNTKSHLRNISRSWLAEKFGIQNHTWERFQEFHSHKSLKYKITFNLNFKKHFRSLGRMWCQDWGRFQEFPSLKSLKITFKKHLTPRKVWGGGGARIEVAGARGSKLSRKYKDEPKPEIKISFKIGKFVF